MNLSKTLSFLSFFLLLPATCKKLDRPQMHERYYEDYSVVYVPATDSYYVSASFTPGNWYVSGARLEKGEWIWFNGRVPDREVSDFEYFAYKWAGQGRPDASFTLGRGNTQYHTFISPSSLYTGKLQVPDTVSKSRGFTIKASGYKNANPGEANLHIASEQGGSMLTLVSDSLVIRPSDLAKFSAGKLYLRFTDLAQRRNEYRADSSRVDISYLVEIKKEVYIK